MMQNSIGRRILAALLPMVCAAGIALPASADFPPALVNAMLTTQKAGSYHMQMTETLGKTSMTSTGDVQSLTPMKMRMSTDMGTGGPAGKMDVIVLGADSYVKTGSGPWKKSPGDSSSYGQMDVASLLAKDKDQYVVTDLGMQLKDGQMLHGYKAVNKSKNFTQMVYVDSAGRLARFEMPNIVIRFSNYGESVNITAPM